MTDSSPRPEETPPKLTIASGGYVLIMMAFVCVALVAWAVAPALMQARDPAPGDGETIESYGFDVSNLELDRAHVVPNLRRRDMVPVMTDASVLSAEEVEMMEGRNKYLVATDRVVGVEINGRARAYPITMLTVHEIVHDELGDTPIAVTYSWPCDSVMVFDRRYEDQTLEFGVSGLVYHSNLMFYDRTATEGEESLWVQLLGRAVSGPRKGQVLRRIHYQLVDWQTWLAQHPQTTVAGRNESMLKRYKDATPVQYFQSDELLFNAAAPPADSPWPAKTRIVAIDGRQKSQVYSYDWLAARVNKNSRVPVPMPMGNVLFEVYPRTKTVHVQLMPELASVHAIHCYWFAWQAMHPDAELPATADDAVPTP